MEWQAGHQPTAGASVTVGHLGLWDSDSGSSGGREESKGPASKEAHLMGTRDVLLDDLWVPAACLHARLHV